MMSLENVIDAVLRKKSVEFSKKIKLKTVKEFILMFQVRLMKNQHP
jgi:hypothetical protein